jgi:poly(A) polymerase
LPDPERLAPQPWMTEPKVRAVIAALEARGGPACARFVGGCVRNAVMRRAVDEIDIATTLTPPQVQEALAAAGLKSAPTGIEHGTVTAIAGGAPYEVTTLRRDVSTDGRRAVVAFTTDWSEDAQRRDFRFNALYADPEGAIFDPTGEGLADARAGRTVFVGAPGERIREDYLRILRFFRFHAWYGRGDPDPAGLAACAELKDGIASLSAERIAKELLKLLAADDPRPAVRLMAATGVLTNVLPQAGSLERFERLVGIETEMLFTCDAELRLASLLPDDPETGLAVARALRLSNAQRDRLAAALDSHVRLRSWMSPKEARRHVYRMGAAAFCDKVMLAWAASDRPAATIQWRALLPLAQSWPVPTLPLSGEEVVAAGVPQGPLVGEVLREVEDWWVENDFIDDRLSIVERLKSVATGMVY